MGETELPGGVFGSDDIGSLVDEDRRTLLAPVDFSEHSEAAMLEAAQLAQMMDARLVVLHVVHDPGEMPGYYAKLIKKKRIQRLDDIAAEAFADFMERVILENPDESTLRRAEPLMVIGLPVTRILEVADQLEPVFIVMGSHGRTGLKHLLLGSKAAQVVQLANAPVLVVKTKSPRE